MYTYIYITFPYITIYISNFSSENLYTNPLKIGKTKSFNFPDQNNLLHSCSTLHTHSTKNVIVISWHIYFMPIDFNFKYFHHINDQSSESTTKI